MEVVHTRPVDTRKSVAVHKKPTNIRLLIPLELVAVAILPVLLDELKLQFTLMEKLNLVNWFLKKI